MLCSLYIFYRVFRWTVLTDIRDQRLLLHQEINPQLLIDIQPCGTIYFEPPALPASS